jgi:hypothetical protein
MNYTLSFSEPVKPVRHRLFEIDREYEIAYCTACGWTEIHNLESSTKRYPRFYCTKRFREISIIESEKRRLEAEKSPRHILSEIDPEKMTATCSKCGPAKILIRKYKQVPYYACATKTRDHARKYQRTHYTLRSTKPFAHVLSQIDEDAKTAVCSQCGPVQIYMWQGKRKIGRRCSNAPVRGVPSALQIRSEINTKLINEYKVGCGCRLCGYSADAIRLNLYSRNPEKKDPDTEKLLKLSSKDLMESLASCEVICADCR